MCIRDRNYSADAYGNVFLKLCEKYDPNTILVGATVNGRDLGSKIAVSLRTGLTADCTALSVEAVSYTHLDVYKGQD